MTVHVAIKGVTDLEILLEALREMQIYVENTSHLQEKIRNHTVVAIANIDGRRVGIYRNRDGELTMIGDSDWSCMDDRQFRERILQQYGVVAVKKKAQELGYHIASVDTETDGSIRILARAFG